MRRLITLVLLLLCAACGQQANISDSVALADATFTQSAQPTSAVSPTSSLVTVLATSFDNVTVQDGITHQFLSVSGRMITLGSQRLLAFEYRDSASAEAEARRFSRDGAWIEHNGIPTLVNWIATPHLYRDESLLVIYVGDDASTLNLLDRVLGREFAGGANPYAVAMQVKP